MRVGDAQILSPYFRHAETLFTGAGGIQQVAKSNSTRIGLVFIASLGTNILISTVSNSPAGRGILLTSTVPFISFAFHEFPSLLQSDWYSNLALGQNITVLEEFELGIFTQWDKAPEDFNR